ncbi:MAG: pyridoxamine 5'-phosphate oxidase family protein [Dehalococcoidia bacterium]
MSEATGETGEIDEDAGVETPGDREEMLRACAALAAAQDGGTLATMHSEDGTPYVTFVLLHLRENGEVLFGSGASPQHARNLDATPEASVLIDNREVVKAAPDTFERIVVEGKAEHVGKDDPDYGECIRELRAKSEMAAFFTEQGRMYRLRPRRIVAMRGFAAERRVVEFDDWR